MFVPVWALPTEPFPSPSYLISYFPRNAQFQRLCSSQVLFSSPLTLTGKRCRGSRLSQDHPQREGSGVPSFLSPTTRGWTVKNLRGACRRQRQMSRDVGLCFFNRRVEEVSLDLEGKFSHSTCRHQRWCLFSSLTCPDRAKGIFSTYYLWSTCYVSDIV